ncbi:unannotated protein [freshwater metagenome]|uniref:Unannotated protein n=1 Tax=freshwater metagenome TaxID=449393 RepID=A0A6J6XU81_9ZZZZ
METISFIVFRWRVAITLGGNRVNDDRTRETLGAFEGSFQSLHIVPINGTDVLQTQIFKHSLRRNDVLDALFHAMQGFVDRRAHRHLLQPLASPIKEAFITTSGAQCSQMVS